MNVYDEAHSLAKAIKESNEFKEFDRMRHEIEKDADANAMIGELQKLQLELQTAQMTGSRFHSRVSSPYPWLWIRQQDPLWRSRS